MVDDSIIISGGLKKAKKYSKINKKRFFVLRRTLQTNSVYLDYFDGDSHEKNGRRKTPKKSIPIKECFNICKMVDHRSNYCVAVFTLEETLLLVCSSEDEVQLWLGELRNAHEQERPKYWLLADSTTELAVSYDYCWDVVVLPDKLAQKCPDLAGPRRCCLDVSKESGTMFLLWKCYNCGKSESSAVRSVIQPRQSVSSDTGEVEQLTPSGSSMMCWSFPLKYLKKWKCTKTLVVVWVGRQSDTGEGEIHMETESASTAVNFIASLERLSQEAYKQRERVSYPAAPRSRIGSDSTSSRSSLSPKPAPSVYFPTSVHNKPWRIPQGSSATLPKSFEETGSWRGKNSICGDMVHPQSFDSSFSFRAGGGVSRQPSMSSHMADWTHGGMGGAASVTSSGILRPGAISYLDHHRQIHPGTSTDSISSGTSDGRTSSFSLSVNRMQSELSNPASEPIVEEKEGSGGSVTEYMPMQSPQIGHSHSTSVLPGEYKDMLPAPTNDAKHYRQTSCHVLEEVKSWVTTPDSSSADGSVTGGHVGTAAASGSHSGRCYSLGSKPVLTAGGMGGALYPPRSHLYSSGPHPPPPAPSSSSMRYHEIMAMKSQSSPNSSAVQAAMEGGGDGRQQYPGGSLHHYYGGGLGAVVPAHLSSSLMHRLSAEDRRRANSFTTGWSNYNRVRAACVPRPDSYFLSPSTSDPFLRQRSESFGSGRSNSVKRKISTPYYVTGGGGGSNASNHSDDLAEMDFSTRGPRSPIGSATSFGSNESLGTTSRNRAGSLGSSILSRFWSPRVEQIREHTAEGSSSMIAGSGMGGVGAEGGLTISPLAIVGNNNSHSCYGNYSGMTGGSTANTGYLSTSGGSGSAGNAFAGMNLHGGYPRQHLTSTREVLSSPTPSEQLLAEAANYDASPSEGIGIGYTGAPLTSTGKSCFSGPSPSIVSGCTGVAGNLGVGGSRLAPIPAGSPADYAWMERKSSAGGAVSNVIVASSAGSITPGVNFPNMRSDHPGDAARPVSYNDGFTSEYIEMHYDGSGKLRDTGGNGATRSYSSISGFPTNCGQPGFYGGQPISSVASGSNTSEYVHLETPGSVINSGVRDLVSVSGAAKSHLNSVSRNGPSGFQRSSAAFPVSQSNLSSETGSSNEYLQMNSRASSISSGTASGVLIPPGSEHRERDNSFSGGIPATASVSSGSGSGSNTLIGGGRTQSFGGNGIAGGMASRNVGHHVGSNTPLGVMGAGSAKRNLSAGSNSSGSGGGGSRGKLAPGVNPQSATGRLLRQYDSPLSATTNDSGYLGATGSSGSSSAANSDIVGDQDSGPEHGPTDLDGDGSLCDLKPNVNRKHSASSTGVLGAATGLGAECGQANSHEAEYMTMAAIQNKAVKSQAVEHGGARYKRQCDLLSQGSDGRDNSLLEVNMDALLKLDSHGNCDVPVVMLDEESRESTIEEGQDENLKFFHSTADEIESPTHVYMNVATAPLPSGPAHDLSAEHQPSSRLRSSPAAKKGINSLQMWELPDVPSYINMMPASPKPASTAGSGSQSPKTPSGLGVELGRDNYPIPSQSFHDSSVPAADKPHLGAPNENVLGVDLSGDVDAVHPASASVSVDGNSPRRLEGSAGRSLGRDQANASMNYSSGKLGKDADPGLISSGDLSVVIGSHADETSNSKKLTKRGSFRRGSGKEKQLGSEKSSNKGGIFWFWKGNKQQQKTAACSNPAGVDVKSDLLIKQTSASSLDSKTGVADPRIKTTPDKSPFPKIWANRKSTAGISSIEEHAATTGTSSSSLPTTGTASPTPPVPTVSADPASSCCNCKPGVGATLASNTESRSLITKTRSDRSLECRHVTTGSPSAHVTAYHQSISERRGVAGRRGGRLAASNSNIAGSRHGSSVGSFNPDDPSPSVSFVSASLKPPSTYGSSSNVSPASSSGREMMGSDDDPGLWMGQGHAGSTGAESSPGASTKDDRLRSFSGQSYLPEMASPPRYLHSISQPSSSPHRSSDSKVVSGRSSVTGRGPVATHRGQYIGEERLPHASAGNRRLEFSGSSMPPAGQSDFEVNAENRGAVRSFEKASYAPPHFRVGMLSCSTAPVMPSDYVPFFPSSDSPHSLAPSGQARDAGRLHSPQQLQQQYLMSSQPASVHQKHSSGSSNGSSVVGYAGLLTIGEQVQADSNYVTCGGGGSTLPPTSSSDYFSSQPQLNNSMSENSCEVRNDELPRLDYATLDLPPAASMERSNSQVMGPQPSPSSCSSSGSGSCGSGSQQSSGSTVAAKSTEARHFFAPGSNLSYGTATASGNSGVSGSSAVTIADASSVNYAEIDIKRSEGLKRMNKR